MKRLKQGFTLIELLGVIIILSLLMMLLVPNVLEQINNKKGDINCDGNIGIADIVMLEKFLLGCGKDNQNADLNSDGVINVYDLILMRKELIKIN